MLVIGSKQHKLKQMILTKLNLGIISVVISARQVSEIILYQMPQESSKEYRKNA